MRLHLPNLTSDERARFEALASATSLADLVRLTEADSTDEAYVSAKREWRTLTDTGLPHADDSTEFPGDRVSIDGLDIHVHGITHTDTTAEGTFVRNHVRSYIDGGGSVYCEQGIRRMYFGEFDRVREMDDYRWAMERCRSLSSDANLIESILGLGGLLENFHAATDEIRTAIFDLIESSGELYGDRVSRALGDVATSFLTRKTDLGIGLDYRSFVLSRQAAVDPTTLGTLQRYYRTAFLPPPIEREWLRDLDPELELMTHGRSERMADYVVHDHGGNDPVHVIVGAAHQPGVRYYLNRYRTGARSPGEFEWIE